MDRNKAALSVGIVAAAALYFLANSGAGAGADEPPVVSSTQKEAFSGELPDSTYTYASFHCGDVEGGGNMLLSANAYRQIGSGPVTPLAVVDYTATTFPEGAVVVLDNDSGHDEMYRVTLICGTAIEN